MLDRVLWLEQRGHLLPLLVDNSRQWVWFTTITCLPEASYIKPMARYTEDQYR